ncbi:DUF998 domain-containing protein [Streptomyces sp. HNM0663]|uniref:DUF998 domain-containing protein n=1 Tax=Streptomyces chengmaiensis TaxID=3040919 RepID=A0ABT6HKU6_9ACTN|nr:DUF998 domain-containing protein [Streptomyces chengmaiensis]MDH2388659.1 DUF998 domain-containing protein [Streptomyces chengmaiensis]
MSRCALSQRALSPRAARPVALLIALGAVAYTAWVLEVVVATGLNPVQTYVSELAAADQPLGGLFRATDLAAGLLVLAGALPALWSGERSRRTVWEVVGWSGLALFGAATAVDSRLPLSCTPTADPVCAARETAGLVPATHTAHAVSSALAMTGALVGVVALTVAARRCARPSPLARVGPALVALELAATVWTLAAVAAFEAGRGTWALGAGQRLQVLLVAGWLGVLALTVVRERAVRERTAVRERAAVREQTAVHERKAPVHERKDSRG